MLKKLTAGSIVSVLMVTLLAACTQSNTAPKNAASSQPSATAQATATASTPTPAPKVGYRLFAERS
jgi:uncharacterized lipoprotein